MRSLIRVSVGRADEKWLGAFTQLSRSFMNPISVNFNEGFVQEVY